MALQKLTTQWSDVGDKPLQEYPRPQFRRQSYLNLNGWWQYAFTKIDEQPQRYDGNILVPFSPESALSGVNRQLKPNEFLWYRTEFSLPNSFNKGLVFLNFGAVDSVCEVYFNGRLACRHEGGYNAFSVDVTSLLLPRNTLVVKVTDATETSWRTRGKQTLKRKGMWYTAQSGIWQTVWLESVPSQYIRGVRITPDCDNACVTVETDCNFDEPVTAIIMKDGEEIAKADGKGAVTVRFPDGFRFWSPEDPFLYDLKIISRRDTVDSYFAMRKFGMQKINGKVRLTLNGKPYFHNGLLDQGYWSDGLYTAPSDEAMIYDITAMKQLGFNMLRKHIKVEPMRWYYHCDRLGMLVWQDMPSGGTRQRKWVTMALPFVGINKLKDSSYRMFSREEKESRNAFLREYGEMLNQLYNCPCICAWVPFNEGWGQFDAAKVAKITKEFDDTRYVDHASGWHDQGAGDFLSMHVYFKRVRLKTEGRRATVLSEFGGYSYMDKAHSFNPDRTYSYKLFPDRQSFNQGVRKLYEEEVIAKIPQGLCAAVYTQVSDVEEEVNGLLTYDRKVLKIDADMMRDINEKIKNAKL